MSINILHGCQLEKTDERMKRNEKDFERVNTDELFLPIRSLEIALCRRQASALSRIMQSSKAKYILQNTSITFERQI